MQWVIPPVMDPRRPQIQEPSRALKTRSKDLARLSAL